MMGQAALKNCPVCKKKAVEKFRPFCSARCANIDLGGWLGEKYRLPAEEEPDSEDVKAAMPNDEDGDI